MIGKLLRVRNALLVFRPDTLQFVFVSLIFVWDFGGLFLQTGNLQFQILKGYQVPKIGIHLFAPSNLAILEEGITHNGSGLAYLQSRLKLLCNSISSINQGNIHFAATICQCSVASSQLSVV